MTLKIKYIKETFQDKQDRAIEEMINSFNKEAEDRDSKYRIKMKYGYPHLIKKGRFFEDYDQQIHFGREYCSFIEGISEDALEEIKDILESVPEKFIVEIVKDK